MFENPTQGFEAVEAGRYVVKVVRLESTHHVEYGDGIKWVFHLANPLTDPPTPLYQADGTLYELWQTTSTKVTPRSKARPWLETLLGRPIVDGQDTGEALAAAVVGKKAQALIGPNANGYSAILQMMPLGGNGTKAAPQAVAAAPAPSPGVAVLNEDLQPEAF